MTARREMILNAFTMNCVGHINHGLWTHPRDRSGDYKRLGYWTDIAKTLERGLFDAVFIADIVGTYDVYGGSTDLSAREAIQLPVNEPTLLVPAMAAVTENLGFGVTVNIGGEHPFTFARRFSTLDHLTDGRVGWNVVTGYLDSAARGVGLDAVAEHDSRYDRADDYLDVLYKLWEQSWDEDAVVGDRVRRVYSEPSRIHPVRHDGPFYRVSGANLSEPSRQRTPVLFQAGSSGRGQHFAARHAECVFIAARDKATARTMARGIREAAVAVGRHPGDIKVIVGITVVAGRTDADARETLADYLRYACPEAGLAHFSASTGIDFSRYGLDEAVAYGPSNAIQTQVNLARQQRLSKRQLLEQMALGGRYPAIVGNGQTIAAELEDWMVQGEVDGFNLSRTVAPESWEDFVTYAVPALQERGIYKMAYRAGSLRQKLFGQGDRLPERHFSASARRPPETSAAGATLEPDVSGRSIGG